MSRRDGITVVVGAARDVLGSLSSENAALARATIERWVASSSPLLRRLAVDGVRAASWMSADEKLQWLIDRDLLYDSSAKHEVFEVLAVAYPVAGEESRRSALKRAKRGVRAKDNPRLKKSTRDYERYNLLNWLSRAAPRDSQVQEALRQEQEKHSDFAPRDDPDLVIGEIQTAFVESSMTVDQLLKMRVGDARVARRLIEYKDEAHWYDTDRYAFLGAIASATASSPNWGLRLATALSKMGEWNVDLWRGLADGWSTSEADERMWNRVFILLGTHQEPSVFASEASRLLTEFIQKRESYSKAVEEAQRFSDVLWTAVIAEPSAWTVEGADWLTSAINEPGGKIAEFWIRVVSLRMREGETAGLAEPDRARLTSVLDDEGRAAEAGRIVLASQFSFLFAADRGWTTAHIRPLFDWSLGEQGAEQAWDGFLTWARLNEAVIESMLPMYVASFPQLAGRDDRWRRKFTDHLAVIAVQSSRNPVEDQWLTAFVKQTSVESRVDWASHVAHLLRTLETEAQKAQWEKWIRQYWVSRLSGLPRPLARGEASELAAWAVSLRPVFSEAVDLLVQGPAGHPQGYVYDLLGRNSIPDQEPAAVLRLLAHILTDEKQPFYACHYVLAILQQIPQHGLRTDLERVVNQLVGLGCDSAVSIIR